MSGNLEAEVIGGEMPHVKIMHQDASSVDGKRGLFTKLILPGRRDEESETYSEMGADNISKGLEHAIRQKL